MEHRHSIYNQAAFLDNKEMKTKMQSDARADLRRLLVGQKLGVLATREPRSTYQSLVAFAVAEDLQHVYFATGVDTRKYANLVRFPEVSMLFDNRKNTAADFDRGIAVTALGRVGEVKARSGKEVLRLYLGKHPALEGFVRSPSCRMFQLKVQTYIMVSKFRQVRIIQP